MSVGKLDSRSGRAGMVESSQAAFCLVEQISACESELDVNVGMNTLENP